MQTKTIDRRWLPLNALRAFEGVAKHGSFTAAANALLISQSALSRHVIALERLTGVQLFERRPHALTLTKAGQHLLPAVIKSFDRLEYALWSQFVRQTGLSSVNVERGLVVDTAVLAAQYALGAQGIAVLDTNLFAEEISDGRLVKPFEATLDDGYGYYLTTHPEGLADTAIALFRSWLIERFGRAAETRPPLQLAVSNE